MTHYYKQHNRIWISFLALFAAVDLSGCSSILSSKMPPGSVSMTKAYRQAIDGTDDGESGNGTLTKLRSQVQPFNHAVVNQSNNGEVQELNAEFPRLPNPGIVMYVYPHLVGSGTEQVPVPGYATVFNLYQQDHYEISK